MVSEMLLEAVQVDAGEGIAWRDGAAGAGVAALEGNFADGEADDAAFVFAEELVFPERGDTIDFESGAETAADVVDGMAGEPFGDGLERSGGDDRGAIGDGVVGETAGRIANDDLLLEEHAEPLGGLLMFSREREGARGDFAAIGRNGEGDETEVGGIAGADEMNDGGALAIDPFAVDRMKSPGAVESEPAGRGNASFVDGDRIERLDGVEADVGEFGRRHGVILAEGRGMGHPGSLQLSVYSSQFKRREKLREKLNAASAEFAEEEKPRQRRETQDPPSKNEDGAPAMDRAEVQLSLRTASEGGPYKPKSTGRS